MSLTASSPGASPNKAATAPEIRPAEPRSGARLSASRSMGSPHGSPATRARMGRAASAKMTRREEDELAAREEDIQELQEVTKVLRVPHTLRKCSALARALQLAQHFHILISCCLMVPWPSLLLGLAFCFLTNFAACTCKQQSFAQDMLGICQGRVPICQAVPTSVHALHVDLQSLPNAQRTKKKGQQFRSRPGGPGCRLACPAHNMIPAM